MVVAPMVLVDHYDSTFPCDKVLTENEVGAFLAVRHLVELGHRLIGFVGEVERTPSYRERWRGYRTAMRRFGLDVPAVWEQTAVTEMDTIESLEALSSSPTAWFCANDIYASNVIRFLQDSGLQVPGDVAVLGFDDLPLTLTTSPPITTVHVDAERYARHVVDQLMHRIDTPDAPFLSIRIAPELVLRESTAKAREVVSEIHSRED